MRAGKAGPVDGGTTTETSVGTKTRPEATATSARGLLVVGWDPGAWTAFALVELLPRPRLLDCGTLRGARAEGEDLLMEATKNAGRDVDLVAVESVRAMYGRARFGVSMANAIQEATRIEERILAAAKALGIPTSTCTAAEWRGAIVGSRTASDARIKATLGMLIELPRCSAHVRDAVGVALFGAQRARLEGMKRTGSNR